MHVLSNMSALILNMRKAQNGNKLKKNLSSSWQGWKDYYKTNIEGVCNISEPNLSQPFSKLSLGCFSQP